jgi:hypothetical protein
VCTLKIDHEADFFPCSVRLVVATDRAASPAEPAAGCPATSGKGFGRFSDPAERFFPAIVPTHYGDRTNGRLSDERLSESQKIDWPQIFASGSQQLLAEPIANPDMVAAVQTESPRTRESFVPARSP